MYAVIDDYVKYACGAILFTAFCILTYHLVRYFREWFITRNCWFCNAYVKVPFQSRKGWFCVHCNQFNGFTKDGDYSKSIPEMVDEYLNPGLFASNTRKTYWKSDNGLCRICNSKQELKIKQLAAYVPFRENNYDVEIEAFKMKLEDAYKLCSKCEKVLQIALQEKSNMVPKDLLSSVLAKKTMERLKQKLSYSEIGAVLLFLAFIIPFVLYFADEDIRNVFHKGAFVVSPVFEITYPSLLELFQHYPIHYNLVASFLLLETLFLYFIFPEPCSGLFMFLANLTSILFLLNDYSQIMETPDDLKTSIILVEALILPLYCVIRAIVTIWKRKNSPITNEQFLNNFSSSEEYNVAGKSIIKEVQNSKLFANSGVKQISNNSVTAKMNGGSICDNFVGMNLTSTVRQTCSSNGKEKNPFLKIRDRTSLIKPSRFNWNPTNTRTTLDKGSSTTTNTSTSSETSSATDTSSNTSYNSVETAFFPNKHHSPSESRTSNSYLVNNKINSNLPSNLRGHHLSLTPLSSRNNINNHSTDGNASTKYPVGFTGPSSKPLYFCHYSNSIIQTPDYGLLSAYSIVPTGYPSLNCYSSCSSANSNYRNYSKSASSVKCEHHSHSKSASSPIYEHHSHSKSAPSSQCQHQVQTINYTTLFNVVFCCLSCFALGFYLNQQLRS